MNPELPKKAILAQTPTGDQEPVEESTEQHWEPEPMEQHPVERHDDASTEIVADGTAAKPQQVNEVAEHREASADLSSPESRSPQEHFDVLREKIKETEGTTVPIRCPYNLDGMPRPQGMRTGTIDVYGDISENKKLDDIRGLLYAEETNGPDGKIRARLSVVRVGARYMNTRSNTIHTSSDGDTPPNTEVISDYPSEITKALTTLETIYATRADMSLEAHGPVYIREEHITTKGFERTIRRPEDPIASILAASDQDPYGYQVQAAALLPRIYTNYRPEALNAIATFALQTGNASLLEASMAQLTTVQQWRVIAQEGQPQLSRIPAHTRYTCMRDLRALQQRALRQEGETSNDVLDIYTSQLALLLRADTLNVKVIDAQLGIVGPMVRDLLIIEKTLDTLRGGRTNDDLTRILCLLAEAGLIEMADSFYARYAPSTGEEDLGRLAYLRFRERRPIYEAQTATGTSESLYESVQKLCASPSMVSKKARIEKLLREIVPQTYIDYVHPELTVRPYTERVDLQSIFNEVEPQDLAALVRSGYYGAVQEYYEALVRIPKGLSDKAELHVVMLKMALFLAQNQSVKQDTPSTDANKEKGEQNNSDEVSATAEMQIVRELAGDIEAGHIKRENANIEGDLLAAAGAISAMPFSSLKIAYVLEAAALRQRYAAHPKTPNDDYNTQLHALLVDTYDILLHAVWSVAVATLPALGDNSPLPALWEQMRAVGFSSEAFYRIEGREESEGDGPIDKTF
jgi:hypothetical protein